MNIKSVIAIVLASSISFANAQIALETNKSLAQIQESRGDIVETFNVSKVRPQVEVNAGIVATGIVCGFPSSETEFLHNFFLLQFGKYNFSKDEALAIAQIHKEKVSQSILQNRGKVSTADCEKFKPEFAKIYEYAKSIMK